MKNNIKLSVILGIVASFPTCPMESTVCGAIFLPIVNPIKKTACNTRASFMPKDHFLPNCIIELEEMKKLNLFSDMKQLAIGQNHHGVTSASSDDSSLFTDKELAFQLTIIQILEKNRSDVEKNNKNLKTISDAVNRGVSLTSRYCIRPAKRFMQTKKSECIRLSVSDVNSISVFKTMKDWITQKKLGTTDKKTETNTSTQSSIFKIIFEAAGKRTAYINDQLSKDIDDASGIKIPQNIIDLMFSYLHDKENMEIIEQAKKEFE